MSAAREDPHPPGRTTQCSSTDRRTRSTSGRWPPPATAHAVRGRSRHVATPIRRHRDSAPAGSTDPTSRSASPARSAATMRPGRALRSAARQPPRIRTATPCPDPAPPCSCRPDPNGTSLISAGCAYSCTAFARSCRRSPQMSCEPTAVTRKWLPLRLTEENRALARRRYATVVGTASQLHRHSGNASSPTRQERARPPRPGRDPAPRPRPVAEVREDGYREVCCVLSQASEEPSP